MKKTTKILLVLAAVVAMTIGAVSTVMAADEFPTIGEWIAVDADKNIWEAKDTDGNEIVRGWAISEAGRWYFFDSGKMLVNTFVTYKEDIYYLDNTGCMAKGWIGFTNGTKVNTVDKYVKNSYANITLIEGFGNAFEVDETDGFVDALIADYLDRANSFKDDKKADTYDTLWVYFNDNGVMAQDKWEEAFGQWFYLTGPYCVMNDYHVAIDQDTDNDLKDGIDGIYGFDKNGVMLVGWNYVDLGAYKGDATDPDTPYEDLIGVKDATKFWTYYYTDGRQVNTAVTDHTAMSTGRAGKFEGWEKIDDQWCYFIDDEILGQRLLQNTMLYDYDTYANGLLAYNGKEGTFYLDKNGFMVTGVQSFAAKTKLPTWDEEGTTPGQITVHKAGTAYFFFSTSTGEMLDGVIDKYYYLDNGTGDDYDKIFLVESGKDGDITTSGTISIDESTDYLITTGGYIAGQRINKNHNFFLVIDETAPAVDIDFNGDGDKTDKELILYFEAGVWQKNQAITFGETTIGIDKNGYVIGLDKLVGDDDVTVAGLKYEFTTTTLELDGIGTIRGLTRAK